jgi:hypothetical protein
VNDHAKAPVWRILHDAIIRAEIDTDATGISDVGQFLAAAWAIQGERIAL